MAVITIPITAVEQPNQSQSLSESGSKGFQRSFKDAYSTLEEALDDINTGDTLDGKMVKSCSLSRYPGNLGILTLTLSNDDTSGTDTVTQTAQKAVWSCKSVRNDVSIFSYCGGAASRVNLELWMKETDATLAEANSFHKTATQIGLLNSQEIDIANKIRKGVESVIRFYPVLSCTSYWSRIPRTFMQNIGFVNTPSAPTADETLAPSNLNTIISGHSWLKVQDDVSETGDGRFQRVESWMGIDTSDSSNGWDSDLYGSSRWAMPLSSQAPSA